MIIGVISQSSKYKELFEADDNIELVSLMDTFKEDETLPVDIEALLIDGETLAYQDLSKVRKKFNDIPMFYKMHDVNSNMITRNIQRICTSLNISAINEYYTIEQIVQEVLSFITEQKESYKRVISLFGTHSGAGVSTTSFSLAKSVSQRIHERVLLLSLNAWDSADYFLNYDGKYLNDLKVDLKTESLTVNRLTESVFEHNGFYHLAGNRDIKLQRFYTNSEIAHLIEVAEQAFDLVIIDAGTHFDTANATQAYVSSDLRFLVTTQEDKGYRGYFPHVFSQLIEPVGGEKTDFMLVVNRFQPDMSLISERDLEQELEINRIATLPDLHTLGAISIRQKELLYDIGEQEYRNNIDTISNLIISEAHLSEKPFEDLTQRKGFFSSLFGKKEGERVG